MTTISSLDPRTKLFLVACLSSAAVIISHWAFLSGLLLVSILFMLLFGVNLGAMMKKARLLLYMVIVIAFMQSIFAASGPALISLGPIKVISSGGLLMALEFILRMGIILCSAGIISTSNSRELIQGLVQLKLPYELAFMASMGLRFIPVFAEEFQNTSIAIQLRGIDLRMLPWRQKIEVIIALFQPVVVGAIIKSRAVSMSIEMRAFRAYPDRSSYRLLQYSKQDYMFMIGSLIVISLVFGVYYLAFK
ncbi:MAG: energy-coupling factor transporter transmembrane protein EcfT [Syntrophomonadaceae bacterium]|nr:energy-coupling factor transporter transmembrane protein EcfT [Syntrophomonadaceae bacterium]